MKIVPSSAEGLAEAAGVLRSGGVVAYPTETVYGLGADPFSEEALLRLFEIKGRPEAKPVLLIVESASQLMPLVREVNARAALLMGAFWPGPLSLLFPKSECVPRLVTAGGEQVCVRCPDSVTARGLCKAFGGPITSTSANRSGEAPATSIAGFEMPGVELAIDGGVLGRQPPSTVYDPASGRVVREGKITLGTIRACLGEG